MFADKPEMPEKDMTRFLTVCMFIAVILAAALLVATCAGCGNWTLVHKSQFHDTYENFKTYRAHVTPTDEPEKVNQLADLIEEWFKTWKEGYDAGNEKP